MIISFIIVNHNASDQIGELLESIKASIEYCRSCVNIEVIIVDNASCYDEYLKLNQFAKSYSKSQYPNIKVRVFSLSRNYGYSGGVNIGVRLASGDMVVVSNPDIVVEKDFFANLLKTYKFMDKRVFEKCIIAPKILIGRTNKINSTGMILHIAGYGLLADLNKKSDQRLCNKAKLVLAPHGALFIAYKKTLLELGPFDPYYFAFLEDLDLGLRAYAKGYYVAYVPILVVRHFWGLTWGRALSKIKYYYAERNRLLTLLKNMPRRYVPAFLPYILVSELVSLAYATINKYPSLKIRIYADVLRSLKYIRKLRALQLSNAVPGYVYYSSKFITIEFTHLIFPGKYTQMLNKLYKLLNKIFRIPLQA